jgi:hypothetical protein
MKFQIQEVMFMFQAALFLTLLVNVRLRIRRRSLNNNIHQAENGVSLLRTIYKCGRVNMCWGIILVPLLNIIEANQQTFFL